MEYVVKMKMENKYQTSYNSTCPKGGVSYFVDSFVQAESSVLRMKLNGKKPALGVAAKRYAQFDRRIREFKNLTQL